MSQLGVFVLHPWLALLPSAGFALLAVRRGRAVAWLAAGAWLLYAAYESAMALRLLCSGECDIRVDLLLLYPALLLLSIAALVLGGRVRRAEG